MKTIVISAVNIVEAGPLAILRDCLAYLSARNKTNTYRIIALVYQRELADYPHIEYVEMQWPKKRWINRLWCEYMHMKTIEKQLAPVYLWLSLHDTTPRVQAEVRAVYCHNTYSFYKWKKRDLIFAPKIALFALFSKYIYKPNIKRNNFLIVQQDWFRQALATMFGIQQSKIIVAPPESVGQVLPALAALPTEPCSFFFPASPNSHKNFESICQAVEILDKDVNVRNFEVYITLKGDENKYAKWLFEKWGNRFEQLKFIGFLPKQAVYQYYQKCECLIFPSKIESWGLPISEFKQFDKPMLLADLPYARNTAAGASQVSFFDPENPYQLARYMRQIIEGNLGSFEAIPACELQEPSAYSWQELFDLLLAEKKQTL